MGEPALFAPGIEAMSGDALRGLQTARLQAQVERCYAGSAFYREKFRKAGLGPADVRTLDDLVHLPVVTKQELREEQAAHPPFGRGVVAPRESWRELHPSSGTTGEQVKTIWSAADVERITEMTARTMWSFGVRPGDMVQNAFSYGLWVAGLAVHYACARIGCFVIPIGATMTDRQIDYFQHLGSTVFIATPSYALHIAERLRERGVSPEAIPLRIGCFGGEPGAEVEATRRKIEAGLGIDCYDYYGLAEIGPTFASECTAKAGIHWAEDHHIIEVVDPATGQPVPEGEIGVVVITHLTRDATPMIRYWTGDTARLTHEPCPCGRTHARSPGGILGRLDDLIIYRGAKFYPAQVEKVVRSTPWLGDEFRIELTRDPENGTERCTVVAEVLEEGGDPASQTAALRKTLKEELLATPEIRLVKFGTLERTAFKAKRLMDLRKG